MAHVRALDGPVHTEREAPEIVGVHVIHRWV
jgi:hypothetical protein